MRQEKGIPGSTRFELTQLIRLALPLVAAQLAQMGMGVADTIMAGQVGALELAGVALGGAVLWPTLMLVSGVVMSTTPMIAQLNGAGKDAEVGEITRQGLWVALGLGIVLTIGLKSAGPVYLALGIEAAIVDVTMGYLSAASWGMVPVLGYFALRYFCEGLSWTKPAMLIAGIGLLCSLAIGFSSCPLVTQKIPVITTSIPHIPDVYDGFCNCLGEKKRAIRLSTANPKPIKARTNRGGICSA